MRILFSLFGIEYIEGEDLVSTSLNGDPVLEDIIDGLFIIKTQEIIWGYSHRLRDYYWMD